MCVASLLQHFGQQIILFCRPQMQGAVLQHPRLAECYTEVVMKPPTGIFVWLIMLSNFQLALEQGTQKHTTTQPTTKCVTGINFKD